jgi:aldehyde:ferredoxin oxidoreductase
MEEVLECGERIANLRQAFNVREGINMVASPVPARAYGDPPLEGGPNAGVKVGIEKLLQDYLEEMDWSQEAAIPGKQRLLELGLDFVASDLSEIGARSQSDC